MRDWGKWGQQGCGWNKKSITNNAWHAKQVHLKLKLILNISTAEWKTLRSATFFSYKWTETVVQPLALWILLQNSLKTAWASKQPWLSFHFFSVPWSVFSLVFAERSNICSKCCCCFFEEIKKHLQKISGFYLFFGFLQMNRLHLNLSAELVPEDCCILWVV